METTVAIAGLSVRIVHRYDHIPRQCVRYLTDREPDFSVTVTEELIDSERRGAKSDEPMSDGYLESVAAYRLIAAKMLAYDAMLFHSAVIEVDGKAFAFAAESGTGKSTHIRLWRRVYGDAVKIVNGDKPILRFDSDGTLYAYGTPWCGKEGWQRNVRVPLRAVVFVERGRQDEIAPLAKDEAALRFLPGTLLGDTAEQAAATLEMTDRVLAAVDTYLLKCTPNESAAVVAHGALIG